MSSQFSTLSDPVDAELVALRARVAELERALAQAAAPSQAAARHYHALIEHIPALTYISALDATSTTLYISPQVKQIFGITPEEWMQDPTRWSQLVHPDDLEQAQSDMRRAQMTESRVISEYRVVRQDGSVAWLRDESVMVRDDAGRPAFLQGVVLDITDRKEAEETRLDLERRLLQAQKLDSLGVLAGGVAHDFNNLLAAILGNASLALLDLPAEAPARESITQIEHAARRAATLTQQMLAYAGKSRLFVRQFDLNALLSDLEPLVRASVPRTTAVVYDLASQLPPIEADASQIHQVVMNLVVNAAEAIGEAAGTVTVRTALRARWPGATGGDQPYVALEVADTGCGMDAEVQARIFEPFFTTKFTGRGLGLAAVQGIVRVHRGLLEVRSAPGAGTAVTVVLPGVAEAAPGLPDATPAPAAEPGTSLVLVIDDEEQVRAVAARLLGRLGYAALVADSGHAGVELLRQRSGEVACVLLDFTMPGMGGDATFDAIRQVQPTIPVVMMSGYSADDLARRLKGFDLAGFLQKPFGSAELSDALLGAIAAAR